MTPIKVTKYMCDSCGKLFESKRDCQNHEKQNHKCPICQNSYYVYGCQLECSLKDIDKKCHFKMKDAISND